MEGKSMSFTYLISSDTIGHQDPEWGKRLMQVSLWSSWRLLRNRSIFFFWKRSTTLTSGIVGINLAVRKRRKGALRWRLQKN